MTTSYDQTSTPVEQIFPLNFVHRKTEPINNQQLWHFSTFISLSSILGSFIQKSILHADNLIYWNLLTKIIAENRNQRVKNFHETYIYLS